jgi:hypothetical protein
MSSKISEKCTTMAEKHQDISLLSRIHVVERCMENTKSNVVVELSLNADAPKA